MEQRSKAVFEVLDGASVTEVAKRYGVSRQTVHSWLRKYANRGFSALVLLGAGPPGSDGAPPRCRVHPISPASAA